MALTPGARSGIYEVIAQIGVGGMGEVYRKPSAKREGWACGAFAY